MADTKTDYFGTFLDTLGTLRRAPDELTKSVGPSVPSTAWPSSLGSLGPLDQVLLALEKGPLSLKDLLSLLPGVSSYSELIPVAQQLIEIGYAVRKDGDVFALTSSGTEAAAALRKQQ